MQIFIVGGFVRDALLGKEPKDVDYVVVGSSVEEMMQLGYSQVGADFPVFLHPTSKDEYALARIERKSGDGYHGFAINASSDVTLQEDLERRDLTISSIAKCFTTGKLFDPFNGQKDLEDKILRHTSVAFCEDPLRVVRLIRFATCMSEFTIAEETEKLAKEMVKNGDLNHLPNERFWAEITKVFTDVDITTRFFDLVFKFEMHKHVNFFKELFSPDISSIDICKAATLAGARSIVGSLSTEQHLNQVLGAVSKHNGKTIKTASSSLQKIVRSVDNFLRTRPETPHDILEFAKSLHAFSQGSITSEVYGSLWVLYNATSVGSITCEKLDNVFTSIKLMQQIKADKFLHLKGKDIGLALDKARMEAADIFA